MNIKYMAGIALAAFTLFSCDDTTDTIGGSLTDNVDKLEISTDTFQVETRSILADSVLSRSVTGYLGKVRDPETGAYMTGDFMTQFYTPEGFSFPEKDSIVSKKDGMIVADSCDLRLYYTGFYGDSLATMKVTAMELNKPVDEQKFFYSNYDPEKEGYVKSDSKAGSRIYTLADLNVDESTRKKSDYMPNIRIALDKPYKGYDNFGSYIINMYYEHPEYFKNSYSFIHNLVPGFFFKTQSGLGSMAYVTLSQLNVYFRNKTTYTSSDGTKRDTIINAMASFPGTEEVLQTTTINNDMSTLRRLVDEDRSCTYLKSPAGIFTEMTLPVNEIVAGHENDTINTAKIMLTRINDGVQQKAYRLGIPQTLLLLPKADMYSFFEKNQIADYKTSYLASYNSSSNTYTFNNIGGLIKHLNETADKTKADWNKVVIIPVTATYTTIDQRSVLTKVTHDMSLTSTKLVGGPNTKNQITVIYSKFK